MTNFTISTLATTLAEGSIYSFSITPKTALAAAIKVRWEIVADGKIPISADDFATFTGVVDFAASATAAQTVRITATDDSALEPSQNFQIRIYQVVGDDDSTTSQTDDILLGAQAVRLDDNDAPTDTDAESFGKSTPASNGEGNVNTAANTQDFSLNAKGGSDTYIITRYQSGDVKIAESAGIDLIKFDFGVFIERFGEVSTSNFTRLKIEATILTLSTGAKIEIEYPDRSTSFQLGDGEIITSYAAFKTAIGASGTNATATFIEESYEVTTFTIAPDVSANTIAVAAEVLESTGSSDVIGLGGVADVRANGAGGDDTFVITRFQSGDVEIDDTVGTNLIKFDFGVQITAFAEASRISFGAKTISLATLTLSTGAEIEISFPAGAFRFQLGDDTVIETYADFKADIKASGTNAASTLAATHTVSHPSLNSQTTGAVVITHVENSAPIGTPNIGEVLTADTSALTDVEDSTLTFTYQWKLGGADITGATAKTYAPTAIGAYTVTVIATDNADTANIATTAITSAPASVVGLATTVPTATVLGIVFTAKEGGLVNLDTEVAFSAPAPDTSFLTASNRLVVKFGDAVTVQNFFDRLLADSDVTDNFVLSKVADFDGDFVPFNALYNDTFASGSVIEDTPAAATGHFIAVPEAGDTITGYSVQTQGAYGTATVDLSGKWTYVLDNSNAAVNALQAGGRLRDTITIRATESDGEVLDHQLAINIFGSFDSRGTSAADTLGAFADEGDIIYRGLAGNDTIKTGLGSAVVIGGEGNDIITIGTGVATIIYRFDSSATRLAVVDGGDTINNFKRGVDKFVFADVDTTSPINSFAKLQAADTADIAFDFTVITGTSGATLGRITQITIRIDSTNFTSINFDTTDPSSLLIAADVGIASTNTEITDFSLLDDLFGAGNFQLTPVTDLGVSIEPDNLAPTGAVTTNSDAPAVFNLQGIVLTSKGDVINTNTQISFRNATRDTFSTQDLFSVINLTTVFFDSTKANMDTLGKVLTYLETKTAFANNFTITTDANYAASASSALLDSSDGSNTSYFSLPSLEAVGDILTADASKLIDADVLGTFSYQWLRGGADIPTATATTYTLVAGDIGKPITVRVSYTDGKGTAESVTSTIADDTPTTGTVTIDHIEKSAPSDAVNVGETLTAITTDLTDADDNTLTFSYQWKLNGVNIDNGRGIAATHVAKAVGDYSVVVTAVDNVQNVKTDITSAAISVVENNNVPTGGVTVSSATATGGSSVNVHGIVFTVKAGGNANAQTRIIFNNTPTESPPGFSQSSNALFFNYNADMASRDTLGEFLTYLQTQSAVINNFVVTEGVGYNANADVDVFVGGVEGININYNLVTGVGGTTYTADASAIADADGLGTSGFSYQWLRGGADISGAESATYTQVTADVGKIITVRVSYTDGAGTAESVTSVAPDVATTGTVTITAGDTLLPTNTANVANIGETLTAVASAISDANDHALTFTYQWKLGGANITGATAATYVPSAIGSYTIAVTAHDDVNNVSKIFTSAAITITAATNFAPVLTIDDTEIGATHTYNFVENAITAIAISATDDNPFDTRSYELITGGADNAKFNINAATGALSFKAAPDFENPTDAGANNDYAVKVKVSDGRLSDTADITVRVTNVDEGDAIFGVSGRVLVGEALTASVTTADIDVVNAAGYSYQWQVQAGGAGAWADISGAIAVTYTLTAAELGDALRVKVSYTDKSGTAENVISTPSPIVTTIFLAEAAGYTSLTGSALMDMLDNSAGASNIIIRGLAGGDNIKTGTGKTVVIGGAGGEAITIGSGAVTIVETIDSSAAQLTGEGGVDTIHNFSRGTDKILFVDADAGSPITDFASLIAVIVANSNANVQLIFGTSGSTTESKLTSLQTRINNDNTLNINFDTTDLSTLLDISALSGKYTGTRIPTIKAVSSANAVSVLNTVFGAGDWDVTAEYALGFALEPTINANGYAVESGDGGDNTQNDAAGTANKVFQGAGGADTITTGTGINVIIGGAGKDDINLKDGGGTDIIVHRVASVGTAWVNSDGADDIDAFQINTDKFVFVDTDTTALTNTADFLAGLAAGGAEAQVTVTAGGGNFTNKITVLKVKFGTESEYLTINFNGDDGGANLVDYTTLESGLTVTSGNVRIFDVTDFAIFDDLFGTDGFDVTTLGDLGVRIVGDTGILVDVSDYTVSAGGAGENLLDQSAATANQLIQGGGGADAIKSGTGTNVIIGGTGKDDIDLKNEAGTDTVIHRFTSSGTAWVNSDGADDIDAFQINTDKFVFVDTDATALTNTADFLAGLTAGGAEAQVTVTAGGGNFTNKIITLKVKFGTESEYLTINFNGDDGGANLVDYTTLTSGLTVVANETLVFDVTDFAIFDDLFGANGFDVYALDDVGVTIL